MKLDDEIIIEELAEVEIVSVEPVKDAELSELNDVSVGFAVARNITPENTETIDEVHVAPHRNGGLRAAIECMLFVASEPLAIEKIAQHLELEIDKIENAISIICSDFEHHEKGLQLVKIAGGYQLCTKPEYSQYCEMILQPASKKLSKAALETLAVIAYRQPCTIPEIESVRGVSLGGLVRTLCDRGLVKEAGKKHAPGRPTLFVTSEEFLQYFGLNEISELPDIDMLALEEVKALESQKELFPR